MNLIAIQYEACDARQERMGTEVGDAICAAVDAGAAHVPVGLSHDMLRRRSFRQDRKRWLNASYKTACQKVGCDPVSIIFMLFSAYKIAAAIWATLKWLWERYWNNTMTQRIMVGCAGGLPI